MCTRLHILLFFFFFGHHIFALDLVLIKDKDGVTVYKEKNAHGNINRIVANTIIEQNYLKLLALICDAENHKNWVYANHGARIIDSISPFHWIYYSISEAPWPISNRDIVSSVELIVDNEHKILKVKSTGKPDLIPELPDMVRIPLLHSQWSLNKIDNNNTSVELNILVDTGGNIPNWVINLFSANGPYKTLLNMKDEIKKSKYQHAINGPYKKILKDF